MIKGIVGFFVFAIIYFIYGFLISTCSVNPTPPHLEPHHPNPFFDYRGATNISSNRSLGSGDDRDIIDEAKSADLDFVFITDLNLIDPMPLPEGYINNLLVLRASKYSYLDSRLIVYRAEGPIQGSSLNEIQVQLTDLLSQNPLSTGESFTVLTHPFLSGYSWSGEWPVGLSALEIINFRRVQQQRAMESRLSTLWSFLIYPFNPELALIRLFGEPRQELKLWDDLSKQRKVIGHLGIEATAKLIPFTGSILKFPAYETLFRLGSEHVILYSELTGNGRSDKLKILKALHSGSFYFSMDVLGNPKGFNVLLEDKDQPFLMGSLVSWNSHLKFRFELPPVSRETEIQVYRNGLLIKTLPWPTLSIDVDKKGVYRFVVRTKVNLPPPDETQWMPWIYTNPFWVN